MIIRIVTALFLLGASTGLAAQPQEVIKESCSKGFVWRLPLPPPKFSTTETPIKVDGPKTQSVRICNCAADAAGKNMGVWLRAYRSDEALEDAARGNKIKMRRKGAAPDPVGAGGAIPYYLPNLSCVLASSPTIVLAPTDNVETWGTWDVVK